MAITIRELAETDDVEDALALLNRTQGVGLFGVDYLSRRMGRDDSLLVAAFDGTAIVGVAVVEEIQKFDYYRPFDPDIHLELESKKVGSLTTLSVHESRQGQGIGLELTRRRVEWAIARGLEVLVGLSWVSGLKRTSIGTFEGAGFRAVKRVDGFYEESSLENPFDCPGCRAVPCECSAILYRRDLL